jgi:hypothetical protein
MATKSDNKLSAAKKEVFRTKEKLAQKFGKARGNLFSTAFSSFCFFFFSFFVFPFFFFPVPRLQ